MSTLAAKPHIRMRGGETIVEFRVSNAKAASTLFPAATYSSPGLWGYVEEPFAGAWQRNLSTQSTDSALRFSAVFACLSLISGDISKLKPRLMQEQADGTSVEVGNEAVPFLQVLRRPNAYQTRVQFLEEWQTKRLLHGNAYILKERDNRQVVRALYVLDSTAVKVWITEAGEVFYELQRDPLAGINEDSVFVPAEDIVHDREICFWHPLVGVSPLFASAMSALHGTSIQTNASKFFANMSRPSGVLTAPGKISQETAERLRTSWDTNFSGEKLGKIAVLGDGLEYKPLVIPPTDAQLIEQLGWTVGDVARAFGVPPYKLGLQTNVTFSNAGQANQDYYSQTLQKRVIAMQILLAEALELPWEQRYKVWFDLDDLLLMDPLTQAETDQKRIQSGVLAPNEAREKINLARKPGGDTPYLQVQNYSLEALGRRDAEAAAPEGGQAPGGGTPTPPADTPPADEGKAFGSADIVQLAATIAQKFAEAA